MSALTLAFCFLAAIVAVPTLLALASVLLMPHYLDEMDEERL
jgi:hypothetical protein